MPKRNNPKKPVENHKTAAWADTEIVNKISHVSHPSVNQVINAKEYVDGNEK